MKGSDLLVVKAEYGSWEYSLYWGFELSLDQKVLKILGDVEKSVELTEEQALSFFVDADRVKLWDLPSSNYEADMSDDLYHMGVSIDARRGQDQRFYHKVETDVFVMVPSRKVNKVQHVSFSTFVHASTRRAAEYSQVPVPEMLTMKWRAKNKNLE